MSAEIFKQAQGIMRNLQSSQDFEHGGIESRGIRIQTASFLENMAGLAIESPDLGEVVLSMATLVAAASTEYGTYVRIKGGVEEIDINIRGLAGRENEPKTTLELRMIGIRRSGVHIYVYPDGESMIFAEGSEFLKIGSGQSYVEKVNQEIERLNKEQKGRLASSVVGIVTREVAQSGEFLGL